MVGVLWHLTARHMVIRSTCLILNNFLIILKAFKKMEESILRKNLKVWPPLNMPGMISKEPWIGLRSFFVLEHIREIYPAMATAKNILQTSLQNGNSVIHPTITLLNAALIERTGGDFFFYEEGVTPAVGRLIKAVDEERIAIGKKNV
jgi:hypothetical protein